MDALGSVAVVGQLLAQALNIWQQIDLARQAVKASPKLLEDLIVQSTNLQTILRDIMVSKELQTPAIHSQIKYIYSTSLELKTALDRATILNLQSFLRQSLHTLIYRHRNESRLNDILSRLEKAKIELLIRINLIHLERTGEILNRLHRDGYHNEMLIDAAIPRDPRVK